MQLHTDSFLQGGKYKIEKELGQGGFGITYLGTQVALNRKVAIKEFFMKEYCNRNEATSHVSVPSEGSKELVAKFKAKFIKEAQIIAKLSHPHIIRIHDIFEENGTAYYVMEYWNNGSLFEYVKSRGRLNETEALHYIRQIADALGYIHNHNMNHLDVKPGNILLGENKDAVLIDFGLSKQYDQEGNQTSTTPVAISHGYAPLEQYKKGGVGTFSPTTDIYSLGATLYKLVTGQTPPDANDVMDEGLPALPSFVSSSTVLAIKNAMQTSRKNRPQSVREFLEMLGNEVDEKTVLWEEENIQFENALPIGCQLCSNSSVYKIIACVGKDSCSFVYKAIKKGQISEEVILLENMPNDFMGGRVGDISTGKYWMDCSISDLAEWTGLFDEKIKILSRNYKVIEHFSVGWDTHFVSFKAPIKKELLDACCMTKHFTKQQYNETEDTFPEIASQKRSDFVNKKTKENNVNTQLFTVPQNTQRIKISYREYGIPCPSNFDVQITRKDIRIEHFYLNEETLSTQLFTKRRFQNLKNEISAFQMKCTSEKSDDFGAGGTEIILTFIDEKYYTLNTISTRVRDDNSLYIFESNKNIAYEIERLLPEVVEFISENKQKLELKHAQNNNNQPLKGNTSEKEKSWLGILGELVGLILTTYLPLIGIILIIIVMLNVNGLGQLIATGVISTCSLYYTIKAEYFDNKFMKFIFILIYGFFIFATGIGIYNGEY